ncbi:ADP-forming succinate--CoA ligase subunit beta [Alphaproteobacteria bacterium]|nr:ADP-forming succinate--CoA ligase subunit beta [Alphaproteobacteria bacterium]
MNIHEYQSKELFKDYGIKTLKGKIAFSSEEAVGIAKSLDSDKWVVKAQIHAGGRGKGGGVKIAHSIEEVDSYSNQIIGMNLITPQTGPQGKKVLKVYIEEACKIKKEFYLGIVLDRAKGKFVMMASTEGGMDIEKVASETPEKIFKVDIDPLMGINDFQARQIAFSLNIPNQALKDFLKQIKLLSKISVEKDFTLVEINPLILTEDNQVIALDAKINIDDNALFRNKELKSLVDESEIDPKELEAEKYDLSYVKLDGKIGCMVNGAGLAMATMDIIKLKGSSPANFLDVGGGASKEKVTGALKIIISDKNVEAILINIFGGIMRCDIIAQGIVEAVKEISLDKPLIVRLEGTNVEKGKEILKKSGLEIITAIDLEDAADRVVSVIRKK